MSRSRLSAEQIEEEQEDQSANRELTDREKWLADLGRRQNGRFSYQNSLRKEVEKYCQETGKEVDLVFGAVTRGRAFQNDGNQRIGAIAQAFYDWQRRNKA